MDIDTTLECRGAGAPYIPPDIVNHIVSHVGEDHATLLSCSLVCRSWSFETSPFIFKRLHIYSDKRTVYDFVDILQRCPRLCQFKRLYITRPVEHDTLAQILQLLPGLVYLALFVETFVPGAGR